MNHSNDQQRCGFVALVGRPNVGKSTLLNRLLGQKISITSRKPQTTRHRITGIDTRGPCQAIFVDTPGIHNKQTKAINRYMNKVATTAITDVDVVVFIVDRMNWTEEDSIVVQSISQAKVPFFIVVNKIDRVENKSELYPYADSLMKEYGCEHIVPISAKAGQNVDELRELIFSYLPQNDHLFDADQITDRSERFLAAELIREKIMRQMGDELPYKVAVEIENFESDERLTRIDALIWVEREGQKKMLIGKSGERLKKIGTEARKDIEVMIDHKVMLKLWVKIKSSWSDDDRMLKSLGYES